MAFKTIFGLAGLLFASILFSGCNKPYLPWVKSSNWDSQEERPERVVQPRTLQRPVEDWCRDMEEQIDTWRSWVMGCWVSNNASYECELISKSEQERREDYLRELIEEYDERCSRE